jgi:hypothetical protein
MKTVPVPTVEVPEVEDLDVSLADIKEWLSHPITKVVLCFIVAEVVYQVAMKKIPGMYEKGLALISAKAE